MKSKNSVTEVFEGVSEAMAESILREMSYRQARLKLRKLFKCMIKYKYQPSSQTISFVNYMDDLLVDLQNDLQDYNDYNNDYDLYDMFPNEELEELRLKGIKDAAREIGMLYTDIVENEKKDSKPDNLLYGDYCDDECKYSEECEDLFGGSTIITIEEDIHSIILHYCLFRYLWNVTKSEEVKEEFRRRGYICTFKCKARKHKAKEVIKDDHRIIS